MPLPTELRTRLEDPDFWRAYCFDVGADDAADEDEEPDVEVVPLGAVFPVGGGYALVLDFDTGFGIVRLGMRTPDSASTLELGWDDQAHWHPDALRWTELDLIARAAAVVDPTLRHPGPVLALAARFVVLDHGDDLDAITPLMDAAFGSPPPPRVETDPMTPTLPIDFGPPVPVAVWWPRTRAWLHRVDGRHSGVAWRQEAGTWTVDQDDSVDVDRYLYTLRRPDGEFPFAAWRDLLTAAETTLATGDLPAASGPAEQCWIDEERAGLPRGSLVAARFGVSPLRDSRLHRLRLELPVGGHAYAVRVDLHRTLREADLGWAETSGSTPAPGGGQAMTISIGVVDSVEAGVALIQQVLRRHRTGPEARLTFHREPIPLDLLVHSADADQGQLRRLSAPGRNGG
ncbi:hypothetical protein ACFO1B_38805 [Dactylosporangium siamense]|uniref:Uncharacterized protein n=1 Tax=Dactylosporangium siamense TaxID=685454 RepID=A0A919PT39_9ACTN|nr:hypothetical protein [Dactylosporangium siamense]GIG50370.1 hypothetical protein Dsi01nite_084110 [Dactylosporangium siamense]